MRRCVIPSRASAAAAVAVRRCVTQAAVTGDARAFYNESGPGGGNDRNWLLSQAGGPTFTNHHFGVGPSEFIETHRDALFGSEPIPPYNNAEEDGVDLKSPRQEPPETVTAPVSLAAPSTQLYKATLSSDAQSFLSTPEVQAAIAKDIHGLELAQADAVIGHLGPLSSSNRVLDLGCGRGGTALRLWQKSGAEVHGVNVSEDQCKYATAEAERHGATEKVTFHLQDMMELASHDAFRRGSFSHAFANETDMYILDIDRLYKSVWGMLAKPAKHVVPKDCAVAYHDGCDGPVRVDFIARDATTGASTSGDIPRPKPHVAHPGRFTEHPGRFTLATWCNTARHGKSNLCSEPIDENYKTVMHTDKELITALARAGFSRVDVYDSTLVARPYWDVRSLWEHRSGVEPHFVEGLAGGFVRYLFITATV